MAVTGPAFLKRIAKPPITTLLYHCGANGWRLNRIGHPQGWALVLSYHRVNGQRASERQDATAFEKGITKNRFDRHMRFVRDHLHPTPLDEIAEMIRRGRKIPSKTVAVTFDDGYEDSFTVAYPTLRRYRIPATVFVFTELIGSSRLAWWDPLSELIKKTKRATLEVSHLRPRPTPPAILAIGSYPLMKPRQKERVIDDLSAWARTLSPPEISLLLATVQEQCDVSQIELSPIRRMMTCDQAREMCRDLVSVQSNTHTHPNMARLRENEAKQELAISKEIIETSIRQPVRGFAYPFGKAYPDPRGLSTLAYDLGYTHGCIGGDRPLYSHTDPYLMNRFAVPNVPMPALLRDMLVSLVETHTTR